MACAQHTGLGPPNKEPTVSNLSQPANFASAIPELEKLTDVAKRLGTSPEHLRRLSVQAPPAFVEVHRTSKRIEHVVKAELEVWFHGNVLTSASSPFAGPKFLGEGH